ncbi:unnamed protein product [Clavelina lepadiformis]|uniref:Uncharacterized protein n=1 Tax=Clavelina lepadiformis TaxID=159417 RepID=A0ABP0H215_CLALP
MFFLKTNKRCLSDIFDFCSKKLQNLYKTVASLAVLLRGYKYSNLSRTFIYYNTCSLDTNKIIWSSFVQTVYFHFGHNETKNNTSQIHMHYKSCLASQILTANKLYCTNFIIFVQGPVGA